MRVRPTDLRTLCKEDSVLVFPDQEKMILFKASEVLNVSSSGIQNPDKMADTQLALNTLEEDGF